MAYTYLAPQTITAAGLQATYSAAPGAGAGNGSAIDGTGDIVLHVKNGGGAPITVTVITGGTLEGEPVADKAITVTNGTEKFIGPFRPTAFNQPSGGSNPNQVLVDYSAITSVTVAALKSL